MAKSQKASVNPKEKSSLLDEEIDTDFLSSWKSMSVMEDDGMDFSFGTASKGKKKAFNFDKLDMDFNLDGDFNKLSSFKMDMSDLDFSSPPRKAAKTKETEEEPSRGNRQGKQDNFNFSFDFNELDNFDLDSSLKKSEKNSKKNPDSSKEVVCDKIGLTCSTIKLAEEISTLDGDSERVATSKVDTSLVVSGNVKSMNDDRASESETSENLKLPQDTRPPEKICTRSVEESYATQATLDQESVLPEKAMPIEPHAIQVTRDQQSDLSEKGMPAEPHATQATNDQQCDLSEKEMPAEPHATQATHDQQSDLSEIAMPTEPHATQATHNFPGQLIGGVDSNGDTVFKGKNDGDSQITKVNTVPSGEEDVSSKLSVGDCPNHEESPLKDSYPMTIAGLGSNNGDRSKSGSPISTANSEPAKDDLDLEDNSSTFVSKKTPQNIESIKEDQTSTIKLPLSIQGSESSADKVTLTRTGEFHSKISKRLEEAGSHFSQPSLVGAKSLLSGIKRSGTMPLPPTIDHGMGANANDALIASKLFATPVLVDREMKVKLVVPGREGFNSDGVPNRAKLVGNSRLCDEEVTERELVVGNGQKKNINNDLRLVEISSSQTSPSSSTEKTVKPSTQTFVNPKLMLSSLESMRNSKITAEGNKRYPDKPAKNKTDLSPWNISKNLGGNKVSLNSTPQNLVKSQRNSEQNMEVRGNGELKTQIVDRSVKQMSPNLSLKRKTFEGSDSGLASLRPLKRLSQSPREIRNVQGPSKGVAEEQVPFTKLLRNVQVQIHDSRLERRTKSSSDDHPSSGLGSPSAVNAMELEIHSLMENDGNVEKAEAYTRELEDICNMLKKKHEEAKEILVRAVVNNNNLLMLNHPIYEAKIQKVQKLAAKLVSKEVHACSRSPTVVM